jgi:glycosyltransferase involved in cell wall biosynthesis
MSMIDEEVEGFIDAHRHIVCFDYQESIEEFMAAMDIFVLPSYREGFGVVNVEAAAMGLPVVSTAIDGVRDSVLDDQTGFLVSVRSVGGLVEKIELLIKDEELRKRMGEAGKQWAKIFEQRSHWEQIFQHRLQLLSGSVSYDKEQDKLFAEVKQ